MKTNWIQRILGRFGTNTDAAGTTTVFARLKQIVDTYLADGTHGLAALETLIDNLEPSQFSYAGTVTGVVAAPKFQCSGLVGHGDDYFKGFWAYVVWDAAGGGAAPQGQSLECTGYDSATGDFTVAAFAPNIIAVGDKVLLIHPSLAYMLNLTPTRADYLDELDFDLQGTLATIAGYIDAEIAAILALVDSGEAVGPFSYLDAGAEQTVKEDTAVTRRRIWLDFSNRNMTQIGTFRIYRKVDGANYDLYAPQAVTVGAGDERAWDVEFTTNQPWKLTYEEGVDEGANRDIPYNVITQVIE